MLAVPMSASSVLDIMASSPVHSLHRVGQTNASPAAPPSSAAASSSATRRSGSAPSVPALSLAHGHAGAPANSSPSFVTRFLAHTPTASGGSSNSPSTNFSFSDVGGVGGSATAPGASPRTPKRPRHFTFDAHNSGSSSGGSGGNGSSPGSDGAGASNNKFRFGADRSPFFGAKKPPTPATASAQAMCISPLAVGRVPPKRAETVSAFWHTREDEAEERARGSVSVRGAFQRSQSASALPLESGSFAPSLDSRSGGGSETSSYRGMVVATSQLNVTGPVGMSNGDSDEDEEEDEEGEEDAAGPFAVKADARSSGSTSPVFSDSEEEEEDDDDDDDEDYTENSNSNRKPRGSTVSSSGRRQRRAAAAARAATASLAKAEREESRKSAGKAASTTPAKGKGKGRRGRRSADGGASPDMSRRHRHRETDKRRRERIKQHMEELGGLAGAEHGDQASILAAACAVLRDQRKEIGSLRKRANAATSSSSSSTRKRHRSKSGHRRHKSATVAMKMEEDGDAVMTHGAEPKQKRRRRDSEEDESSVSGGESNDGVVRFGPAAAAASGSLGMSSSTPATPASSVAGDVFGPTTAAAAGKSLLSRCVGQVLATKDLRMVECNARFAEVMGVGPSASASLLSFVPMEDAAQFGQALSMLTRGQTNTLSVAARFRTRGGRTFGARAQVVSMNGVEGKDYVLLSMPM